MQAGPKKKLQEKVRNLPLFRCCIYCILYCQSWPGLLEESKPDWDRTFSDAGLPGRIRPNRTYALVAHRESAPTIRERQPVRIRSRAAVKDVFQAAIEFAAPKATELTPRKDGGMRIAGQMEMSATTLGSCGRSRFDSGAIHQMPKLTAYRDKMRPT